MAEYQAKPNSGSLFANDKKEKDTHPDFKGDMVLGPELVAEIAALVNAGKPAKVQVAGWKKTTKNGKVFLSLSLSGEFKPKGDRPRPARTEITEDLF
jgi:uncharacterized protein (DUF736 family)